MTDAPSTAIIQAAGSIDALERGTLEDLPFQLLANAVQPYTKVLWLDIPDNATEADIDVFIAATKKIGTSVEWWRADIGMWVEDHFFDGDMSYKDQVILSGRLGTSVSRFRCSITTARNFPPERRRRVSFSHHEALNGIRADKQDEILDIVEAERLSVRGTYILAHGQPMREGEAQAYRSGATPEFWEPLGINVEWPEEKVIVLKTDDIDYKIEAMQVRPDGFTRNNQPQHEQVQGV